MRTIEGRAKRRADDCKNLKDRREPPIKPDQAHDRCLQVEHGHATCAAKRSTDVEAPRFQLQAQLRLEWRGQDGPSETEQPDHFVSWGNSVTLSTRMRFSAHTVGQYPARTLFFGNPWQLDELGRRGIRSIEWIKQYLRHRGRSHGKAEKLDIHPPFVLYTWRGKEGDNTPVMLDIKIPEDFTNAPRSSLIVNQLTTMVQTKPDGYD